MLEINDSNFENEILKSNKPAMVDFWAPWCGPCRAMGPVVEELANAYGDKITISKCNVDDNPITPSKYSIRSIPTIIFFKNGEVIEQITGVVPKSKLENSLNLL